MIVLVLISSNCSRTVNGPLDLSGIYTDYHTRSVYVNSMPVITDTIITNKIIYRINDSTYKTGKFHASDTGQTLFYGWKDIQFILRPDHKIFMVDEPDAWNSDTAYFDRNTHTIYHLSRFSRASPALYEKHRLVKNSYLTRLFE